MRLMRPILGVALVASVSLVQGTEAQATTVDTTNAAAASPADVGSLDAIIHALYEVISGPAGPRDWRRFRTLFAPGARLIPTIRDSTGHRHVMVMTPDEFVAEATPAFMKGPF